MNTREYLTKLGAVHVTQAWFVASVGLTAYAIHLIAGFPWAVLWAGIGAFVIGALSLLAYRVTRSTTFAERLAELAD